MNVVDIRALMYIKYLRLLEKHGWKYAQLCMGERRMELIGQYLNEKSLYKQSIWAMV